MQQTTAIRMDVSSTSTCFVKNSHSLNVSNELHLMLKMTPQYIRFVRLGKDE